MLCKMRKYAAALMLAVLGAGPAFGQTGYIPNGAGPATQAGTGLNPSLPSLVSRVSEAGLALGQTGYIPNGAGTVTQAGTGLNPTMPALISGPATAVSVGNSGTNGCVFCNQSACPHCNPYEDNNGPLLDCNPCLDSPSWVSPGWFAVELDVVGSHIKNRLQGQVGSDPIHLPTAELDWTVSPRIELGYHCARAKASCSWLTSSKPTRGVKNAGQLRPGRRSGELHSRLNINAWDIDYGSREYGLWPCCDMRWRAGVRLAGVFFDSTDNSPILEEREANYYFGAGPHIGLDLRRFVMGTEDAIHWPHGIGILNWANSPNFRGGLCQRPLDEYAGHTLVGHPGRSGLGAAGL